MFDFFQKNDSESPNDDNTSTRDDSPTTSATTRTTPLHSVSEDVKSPKKSKKKNYFRDRTATSTLVSEGLVERLFEPAQWRHIVSAPANMRLAQTGRDYWELSEEEIEGLSISASQCAKIYGRMEPKHLILVMLLFNVSTVYGSRIIRDVLETRRARMPDITRSGEKA